MERNAKIRQEIKDMDAKETERKKKQEQRRMEKNRSKDGSESSTSQPERSEAVIELIKLVEREAMRLQIIKDEEAKANKAQIKERVRIYGFGNAIPDDAEKRAFSPAARAPPAATSSLTDPTPLKLPRPVIDYMEQARQKQAARVMKMFELLERETMRRQGIKYMDSREAERKKRKYSEAVIEMIELLDREAMRRLEIKYMDAREAERKKKQEQRKKKTAVKNKKQEEKKARDGTPDGQQKAQETRDGDLREKKLDQVAPSTEQQSLSKFQMAVRKSLAEDDFIQMTIDVLHPVPRKERWEFRKALELIRDLSAKRLYELQKIDIQIVLERLPETEFEELNVVGARKEIKKEEPPSPYYLLRMTHERMLQEARVAAIACQNPLVDPNLKPPEPVIDNVEQARQRMAASYQILAELEKEAKRRQEIKDEEAKEPASPPAAGAHQQKSLY
ncbi:hypothetical protein GCK72_024755 [Caenorhabditis remanei]|uniref:Uncharacterized protein n=1 Tax=Caenorhabditis remanei TaxID=31234 RepID=A0A6A5G038_CAERE|nr:hypothetical protein GCK72_024755 [Caenorhabditis remanei]KAF1748288.1 hypothetical protein GCK72_024755 [Caenorhabditis remanei]